MVTYGVCRLLRCNGEVARWTRERERERGKSEMLQVMKGESERKERERERKSLLTEVPYYRGWY